MTLQQRSDGEPAGAAAARQQDSDTLAKSYRYLRLAMVGLLLCLAAAVVYQSVRQAHLLGSVSAYYYTPAQAIFVGGLIGLGACMIALQGTTTVQDVSLNLGGVFAAMVAIVPTARDADYRALVRACQQAGTPLLTQKAPTAGRLGCPDVLALEAATRANVDNNLFALLVVGAVALLASLVVAWTGGPLKPQADGRAKRKFWWGFGAMSVLWLAVLVARVVSLRWVVDNAHWVAAVLLFVCIFVVGVVNARDYKEEQSGDGSREGQSARDAVRETVGDLVAVRQRPDQYIWIARLMLLVAAVALVLWRADLITLFWVEAAVFVFFMVFWTVQTFALERSTKPAAAVPQPSAPTTSTPTLPPEPA